MTAQGWLPLDVGSTLLLGQRCKFGRFHQMKDAFAHVVHIFDGFVQGALIRAGPRKDTIE